MKWVKEFTELLVSTEENVGEGVLSYDNYTLYAAVKIISR
jgi:hypothetical protein